MRDVITLITETFTTDEYGNQNATESTKDVFAEVMSITQNEFYKAGETGHRPVFRFDVFQGDYSGERICGYKQQKYYLYRAFLRGDTYELYAEERGGVYDSSTDVQTDK